MSTIPKSEFIERVIGWDVKNWSPVLEYWEESIRDVPRGKALDIGCGPGGLSAWLASLGFEVTCSDLEVPGEAVKKLHAELGVSNISYSAVNALDIPYENEFDVIVFKSVVGGVSRDGNDENRFKMMREIHKALKPGGVLIFAENLTASPLHTFFRKNFVSWGASWNYAKIKDMTEALAVFKNLDFKTRGFAGTFVRTEAQRRFLSVFDKLIFDPLFPESWKYIFYGHTKKIS